MPWVVFSFLLIDVGTGLVAELYDVPDGSPPGLAADAQKLLAVAAAAAVLWHRPRIAAALTTLVAAGALTVGPTGEEAWLLLVIGIATAIRSSPRRLGVLVVGAVAWSACFGIQAEHRHPGWWTAGLAYLALAALALAVGLVVRRLLHLRDRRRLRVAQLERERAQLRGVERARLADELQVVVSRGLVRIERELAELDRDPPEVAGLRSALASVDRHSQSLLAQLGALLAVLRTPEVGTADGDPGSAAVRQQRRPGSPSSSAAARRLLVIGAVLAAAAGLAVSVSSGRTPSWDALPTGVLCLLATALLGSRGVGVAAFAVAAYGWLLFRTDRSDALSHVVLIAYVAFVAVLVGLVTRHLVATRRDALRQLRELSHDLTQVESQERGAAARELHDVVAHQLSLTTMAVMASSLSEDRDELSRTLDQIRGMTAAAHDELDDLLAGMHGGAADATVPPVAPGATAQGLSRRLRENGFVPVLAIDHVADALEPTTQRTLARIMQEATTNILRYAPPGARCAYTLGVDGPAVTLTVASPVTACEPRSELSLGWGLRGAQERVELTGGTFRAGQEGDHWLLTVTLPTTRQRGRRDPEGARAGPG